MQIGSGAMVTTKVTIPEGYTMEQIFHKLEDENVCSYDDLMDAAANYSYNYSFIDQSMQGDAKRLEGFLFPDTYEFYQGMQASSAINKFLENFHDRITAEMLEKADERGMTMQEVVTVASMIEKEAANDDERAMIAAVIYNRIAAGMPLQIDSDDHVRPAGAQGCAHRGGHEDRQPVQHLSEQGPAAHADRESRPCVH